MEWKIYVNGKLCPIINKGKAEKEENTCNLCKKELQKQLKNKRKEVDDDF
jgi:PP-loop superfamily ATP-utilizing enzyme